MSMLEKLEKQFEENNTSSESFSDNKNKINHDRREKDIDNAVTASQHVLGKRDFDEPLDPRIKKNVKDLLKLLEDFYDEKIGNSNATYQDACDYIPLFCINGALIATQLGIVYDDYLKLVDIMMVILDIVKEV